MKKVWYSDIPIYMKLKLFKALCIPILLYGCETWIMTKGIMNKLEAFVMRCYRILLGINYLDRIRNDQIMELIKVQPICKSIFKRQLNFHHKLRNDVTNTIAKTYLTYIPEHGSRKRGRPKLTYNSYINNLIVDVLHPA